MKCVFRFKIQISLKIVSCFIILVFRQKISKFKSDNLRINGILLIFHLLILQRSTHHLMCVGHGSNGIGLIVERSSDRSSLLIIFARWRSIAVSVLKRTLWFKSRKAPTIYAPLRHRTLIKTARSRFLRWIVTKNRVALFRYSIKGLEINITIVLTILCGSETRD